MMNRLTPGYTAEHYSTPGVSDHQTCHSHRSRRSKSRRSPRRGHKTLGTIYGHQAAVARGQPGGACGQASNVLNGMSCRPKCWGLDAPLLDTCCSGAGNQTPRLVARGPTASSRMRDRRLSMIVSSGQQHHHQLQQLQQAHHLRETVQASAEIAAHNRPTALYSSNHSTRSPLGGAQSSKSDGIHRSLSYLSARHRLQMRSDLVSPDMNTWIKNSGRQQFNGAAGGGIRRPPHYTCNQLLLPDHSPSNATTSTTTARTTPNVLLANSPMIGSQKEIIVNRVSDLGVTENEAVVQGGLDKCKEPSTTKLLAYPNIDAVSDKEERQVTNDTPQARDRRSGSSRSHHSRDARNGGRTYASDNTNVGDRTDVGNNESPTEPRKRHRKSGKRHKHHGKKSRTRKRKRSGDKEQRANDNEVTDTAKSSDNVPTASIAKEKRYHRRHKKHSHRKRHRDDKRKHSTGDIHSKDINHSKENRNNDDNRYSKDRRYSKDNSDDNRYSKERRYSKDNRNSDDNRYSKHRRQSKYSKNTAYSKPSTDDQPLTKHAHIEPRIVQNKLYPTARLVPPENRSTSEKRNFEPKPNDKTNVTDNDGSSRNKPNSKAAQSRNKNIPSIRIRKYTSDKEK